jgi:secreted PhoX family phosphatase
MGEYFGEVLQRALNRRDLFKTMGLLGTGVLVLSSYSESKGSSVISPSSSSLSFKTIYPNTEDRITVPDGFEWDIIVKWGDALDNGENLNWNRVYEGCTQADVDRQKYCFGYNNDFVGYFKAPDGAEILAVNNEYFNPELAFKDFLDLNTLKPKTGRPTKEESMLMLEAHGVSIVEIKKDKDGKYTYVKGSKYNRRITGSTPIQISGPAKGHRLLKTSKDPNGELVYGTLNNCSAGKTPWGTLLSCEENFHSYFGGDLNNISDSNIKNLHKRYGIPSSYSAWYGFHLYDDRFNIEKEPNEPFRFGWVVEIDPLNPNRPPVKRTALGRIKHEAATCVVGKSGKVVVYMGDDERFQYIYKFVTKGKYDPNNREANFGLLDEGTLYTAKFNDDFTGEWIMLASVEAGKITVNSNLPDIYKNDPVLVFIDTRGAASALGATQMDRPEDFEWNPITKSAWAVMTYNDKRPSPNAPNPRYPNNFGHIIEIKEEGEDPESTKFKWDIPILCGISGSSDTNNQLVLYKKPASNDTPSISAPDNIAIDKLGNVWIATDGNPGKSRLQKNDGVYVLNPFNKELKMFLSGVVGCEICGPEFTNDYKYFFCAIQHPGEDPADTGKMVGQWPYLNDGVKIPRPSVLFVRRKDGKDIYA